MGVAHGDRVIFSTYLGQNRPGVVVSVDELCGSQEIGVRLDHNGYTVYTDQTKLEKET